MNRTYKVKTRVAAAALVTTLASPSLLAADYSDNSAASNWQPPTVAEQKAAVAASIKKMAGHKTASPVLYKVMIDRLERDFTDKGNFNYIEGQAWVGSSTDRLWLKGEASRINGNTDDGNIEAYYSHAIAAYWDAQVGVRHDFSTSDVPSRNWLGFGVQGLAPYKFDTDITAYVGSSGRTALRLTSEYDFFMTQRLIFWPEVEVNLYGKNDPERNLGKGLSDARVALRLRYEIRREFAPYVGVQWTRKFANTASYARQNGDAVHDMQVVAGIRTWW